MTAGPQIPNIGNTAHDILHVGRPNVGPREVFDSLVDRIFAANWLTNDGPLVREFEEALASRLGVRNCVAVSNGTMALGIVIRALELTGEVIIPSFTFVATAHAVAWQGLTPVFADIDRHTHNLDPRSVESVITSRTSGIVGVHLWGRSAAVNELQDIADRYGLSVIYDAAHAFDCTYHSTPIGGFGRAEVFSFHATKFFNTFEGGAIATDDDELARRARLMRNFGFAGYDHVVSEGTNGKMSEVHAAMGLTNLGMIDEFVAGNKKTLDEYARVLSGIPGVSLLEPPTSERANYQYVVAVVQNGEESRDRVLAALHEQGVLARKYFWPGVHRMEPYASTTSGTTSYLSATEWVANRILVLPGGPSLHRQHILRIGDIISRALRDCDVNDET